jgi:hypothetical protein
MLVVRVYVAGVSRRLPMMFFQTIIMESMSGALAFCRAVFTAIPMVTLMFLGRALGCE